MARNSLGLSSLRPSHTLLTPDPPGAGPICQPQDRAFQTSVRGSRVFSFSEEGLVIQISPWRWSGELRFNLVVERLILDQSSTLRIGIAHCLHTMENYALFVWMLQEERGWSLKLLCKISYFWP